MMTENLTDMPEAADPQADATRATILNAAWDLFHHYGFGKTNVGDIAKRSGMSAGNLYRYFRNKQAIGCAVVERHFLELEAAMAAARDAGAGVGDAEAAVRAMVRASVAYTLAVMRNSPHIPELADFVCADADGQVTLDQHLGRVRRMLAEALAAGQAQAQARIRAGAPERMAEALMNATKAFTLPQSLAAWRDPATILPELEMVLDLCFLGLRAR